MTTTELVVVGLLALISFISGQWLLGLVFMGCAVYAVLGAGGIIE